MGGLVSSWSMDENPCTEVGSDNVPFAAAMALSYMLRGSIEDADRWLRQIPRTKRGDVKIALDDLDMMMSRMGNNA